MGYHKYSIDYFHTTYGLTLPHTDVVDAVTVIKPCKAFDLGCGQGRNTLYLNSLGFELTSVDVNAKSIDSLKMIIEKESLFNINASLCDINDTNIEGKYGFIFSTVVFMFLNAERVPSIIQNMQECTEIGGYNLIVSAMDTKAYPCHQGFSFMFKENELKDYYKDWAIIQYNEDIGELHRLDDNGNRIQLQFAMILAKKL